MTRFIYLADTHIGANPMGYQQQKGYPERINELVGLLAEWIRADGRIDFIVHGGDMVDGASRQNIQDAYHVFRFAVPVFLCLGNHDLTENDALATWRMEASGFFASGFPCYYHVERDDCFLSIVPNQWCEIPYYWKDRQAPRLLPEQSGSVRAFLKKNPARPAVLVTHSPVLAVPSGQTGLDEDFHVCDDAFTREILELTGEFPQIHCVLSAHSHVNSRVEKNGAHFVTASAFVETPFEFKLIEIDSARVSMSTIALESRTRFRSDYDFNKTYVQGRPRDRAFTHVWR